MAAFDGFIKTRTRVRIDRDAFVPGMGTLTKSAGATEEGLVHGNQKLKVDHNVTELIVGNHKLTINGTSSSFVRGNADFEFLANYDLAVQGVSSSLFVGTSGSTYMSLRNTRMLGPHLTFNVGAKTSTFVAPLTETHGSPRQTIEPAIRFSLIGQEFTMQASSFLSTPTSVQLIGALTQACGMQAQAIGVSVQGMALNLQLNGISAALNGIGTTLNLFFVDNTPFEVWTGIKLGPNQVM